MKTGTGGGVTEATLEIRLWLEQRPELQKGSRPGRLNRCPASVEIRSHAFRIYDRLYRAERPPDFGLWCLEQAVGRVNKEPRGCGISVRGGFPAAKREGLTLDILRQRARKSATLNARLGELIARQGREKQEELKYHESLRTFTEERREEEEKRLALVRANETALRENRARAGPASLHGRSVFRVPRRTPRATSAFLSSRLSLRRSELQRLRGDGAGLKGLEVFLGNDSQLVDAVIQGLLGTIDRKDVPDVEEIFDLMAKKAQALSGLALYGGLGRDRKDSAGRRPAPRDDSQIRKALAFYHCDPAHE